MVDGGPGARLPVPRAKARQRHGRIARQGAHFGGHHLGWQFRSGARIVFEGGPRFGLFEVRV